MARPPQPSRTPRFSQSRGEPWYRKSEVMVPFLITSIISVLAILFNFPKIQHWVALDSNPAPTPSVLTKSGVGHLLYSINDYSSSVTSLQWSQNGKRLSSTSEDGTTYEWNALTGENRSITPHPNSQNFVPAAIREQDISAARSIEPLPSYDGKYLASIVADSKEIGPNGPQLAHLVVRNKATGQVVITLPGMGAPNWPRVFWSPSSSLFSIVDTELDRTIIDIWDAATGKRLTSFGYMVESCPTCAELSSFSWSPDSKLIAMLSIFGELELWDPMTGQVYTQYQAPYFGEIRWSTDGSQVFISMEELTDTNTGKSPSPALEHAVIDVFSLENYKLQHDDYLTCNEKPDRSKVQFDVASDNRYVAYSCGQGASVYIWDLSQRKLSYTYNGHKHPVTYLAWSPDSCYIASAEEREVQVWQAIDLAGCG